MVPAFVARCVAMRAIIVIAVLLLLTGCGTLTMGQGPDLRVIQQCAAQHPPPPQANVERLGLLPVYFTGSADSNDAGTRQWFADMDACVKASKPTGQTK
jgi:hypothetical protein